MFWNMIYQNNKEGQVQLMIYTSRMEIALSHTNIGVVSFDPCLIYSSRDEQPIRCGFKIQSQPSRRSEVSAPSIDGDVKQRVRWIPELEIQS
jgi:hypothetical protein